MASVQGNPFLFRAIRRIVFNVQNKFYGSGPLCPTGPDLLGHIALRNNFVGVNMDLFHYKNGGYIIYKNRFVISTEYPEYNDERKTAYNKINTKKYDALWNERRIYA